jgi:hypothetical protein
MYNLLAVDVPLAYDEHDDYVLEYDARNNYFTDEDGCIICNIFRFVSPNDLYLFKSKRKNMVVRDSFGKKIHLVWRKS